MFYNFANPYDEEDFFTSPRYNYRRPMQTPQYTPQYRRRDVSPSYSSIRLQPSDDHVRTYQSPQSSIFGEEIPTRRAVPQHHLIQQPVRRTADPDDFFSTLEHQQPQYKTKQQDKHSAPRRRIYKKRNAQSSENKIPTVQEEEDFVETKESNPKVEVVEKEGGPAETTAETNFEPELPKVDEQQDVEEDLEDEKHVKECLQKIEDIKENVTSIGKQVEDLKVKDNSEFKDYAFELTKTEEMLTQKLLELDSIVGDDEVRKHRKEEVLEVQELISQIENLRASRL
ncbi:BAG family molecular chaperone regulator [Acrasis kona]|uniref:BAG family molecular chaperone regulator n=1 Tax=Acrasis kona TaxID=1008807 RepID=A0AAW2Z9C2_9EUKA